jgi:SAM-dependent methyltransferase
MLQNLLGKTLSKIISKFTKVYTDYRKGLLILLFKRGKVLNLGCGKLKIPNALNLDKNPEVNPDIVYDLEKLPLPFKDKEFDVVFAFDVIEHIRNVPELIKEVERISKKSVWTCLDFDKAKENWLNDKTHIFYINKKIWNDIFPREKYFTFSFRNFLVSIST